MSEQEIAQAINAAINAKERRQDNGKNISNGLTLLLIGISAFIGTTVWNNSLAISSIQSNLAMYTGDRFTGVEGIEVTRRIYNVENRLDVVNDSISALETHDTIDTMQHVAIDTHHQELHAPLFHTHKNYMLKKGHE